MTPEPLAADQPKSAPAEDLFGKLDQLLSKHQIGVPHGESAPALPTLTDAVETTSRARDDVPVLHDAVDEDERDREAQQASARQRALQAALYLRLRQRLDEHAASASGGKAPDEHLAQFMRALRGALPEIVRTSVEQVFPNADPLRPRR